MKRFRQGFRKRFVKILLRKKNNKDLSYATERRLERRSIDIFRWLLFLFLHEKMYKRSKIKSDGRYNLDSLRKNSHEQFTSEILRITPQLFNSSTRLHTGVVCSCNTSEILQIRQPKPAPTALKRGGNADLNFFLIFL